MESTILVTNAHKVSGSSSPIEVYAPHASLPANQATKKTITQSAATKFSQMEKTIKYLLKTDSNQASTINSYEQQQQQQQQRMPKMLIANGGISEGFLNSYTSTTTTEVSKFITPLPITANICIKDNLLQPAETDLAAQQLLLVPVETTDAAVNNCSGKDSNRAIITIPSMSNTTGSFGENSANILPAKRTKLQKKEAHFKTKAPFQLVQPDPVPVMATCTTSGGASTTTLNAQKIANSTVGSYSEIFLSSITKHGGGGGQVSQIFGRAPAIPFGTHIQTAPLLLQINDSVPMRPGQDKTNTTEQRKSMESPSVTQISSTVSLIKANYSTAKAISKSVHSPPQVTIEQKQLGYPTTSAGKIIFPNSSKTLDIVVSSLGNNKKLIDVNGQFDGSAINGSSIQDNDCMIVDTVHPLMQESLLKNRLIPNDEPTSPRTKRSHSLNSLNGKHKTTDRKFSTSSEGQLNLKIVETILIIDDDDDDDDTVMVVDASHHNQKAPVTIDLSHSSSDSNSSATKMSNSLLCDEMLPPSASSLSFSSKNNHSSTEPTKLSTVLDMMSNFNMLAWKERIGIAKGTNLKFQLNEFNLLEIHEICPKRDRVHTNYEKAIHERATSPIEPDTNNPLYLCRRCNCHGRATEFLGPEFCSYECLKRDNRKRRSNWATNVDKLVRLNESGFAKIKTSHQDPAKSSNFRWTTYLNYGNGRGCQPAGVDLFLNPFPSGSNMFLIGMKLEAIDPENNSLFCICTVVEKKGFRLRLNFDGYHRMHDFWVNADSMDIFPPGWCAKTNRILQPLKYINILTFNWPTYLAKTKAIAAPRNLFTHLNSSSSSNRFEVGMRLEAIDVKNSGKVCVASVADIIDNRILVHFDGWDNCYDYWTDINSPYIHPVGWHLKNKQKLIVPPELENKFTWSSYLNVTRSLPAVEPMFSTRDPIDFRPNMKMEVVDKKNPSLIRPATVVACKDHRIKVHLDGFALEYCYWMNDDSPDIHPIGWCESTGHELEPPPGFQSLPIKMPCPTKGCRGIGNAKRFDIHLHAVKEFCPYEISNWRADTEKPPRLSEERLNATIKKNSHKTTEPVHTSGNKRKSTHENILNASRNYHNSQIVKLPPSGLPQIKTEIIDPEYELPDESQINIRKEDCSNELQELNNRLSKETTFTVTTLAKEFLCDYGPRLRQNYAIWHNNSSFVPEKIQKNPLAWTTNETADYIEALLCCRQTAEIFRMEDIDGVAYLEICQADLTEVLDISLGKSIKLFSNILHLRELAVTRFADANKNIQRFACT